MKRIFSFIGLLLCFSISNAQVNQTGNFLLYGKDVSYTSISSADNCSPVETLAVKEAFKYLKNLTGIECKSVSPSKQKKLKGINNIIIIASKKSMQQFGEVASKLSYDSLKENGYIIKTIKGKPNYIVISGVTSKGTLNGVYGFIEYLLRQESGKSFADIDFVLDKKVKSLSIPALSIIDNPYSSVNGLELDGFGLNNEVLLNDKTREYVSTQWKQLVDWCRRHKVNLICNWPYGGESMNDFPNIVVLDKKKYPLAVSKFSDDEIRSAAKIRRQLLQYATDNGVDPYLMTYVPGWYTTTIKKNYPEFCGKGSHGDADGFGSKAFNWGSESMHVFLADVSKAVAEQYPEAKGIHFRVWGGESAPDVDNKERKVELIRKMIAGIVGAVVDERKDMKFIISEYTEFKDEDLSFVHQLSALSPNIIIHRKWDEDWGVSNDPKIPSRPNWLNTNDGVKRAVSHSIPNEEAIPLWFPTVKLYQEGILKYVRPNEETINGWVVNYRDWHTANSDNVLNLNGLIRIAWDPFHFSWQKYYEDSYYFLFGENAYNTISQASALVTEAMSDFMYNYGGIIDGMDSKNWLNITKALVGKPNPDKWGRKIAHILDKENDKDKLSKIRKHIEIVLSSQQRAVELLESIDKKVSKNREMFQNLLNDNKALLYLLQSRLAAVNMVSNKKGSVEREEYYRQFVKYDDMLAKTVALLTNVTAQSMYDDTEKIKQGFIEQIRQEQKYVKENALQ